MTAYPSMKLEARKYLYDVDRALALIQQFTKEITFEEYDHDPLLRSAVERQFEIVGEALRGLSSVAPDVAERVSNYRRIIAFRNRLIHGYASVSNEVVWGVVESDLISLRRDVRTLLAQDPE